MKLNFYLLIITLAISTLAKAQNESGNCVHLHYDANAITNQCDAILIGDIETQNGLDNYTIEFWMNPEVIPQYGPQIGSDTNTDGIRARFTEVGLITIWSGTGGTKFETDQEQATKVQEILQTNTWIHAAFSFAGNGTTGQMSVYLNGELIGTGTDLSSPSAGFKNFQIGGTTLTNANFAKRRLEGKMDEFRIWKVAKTKEQIIESMRRELTATEKASADLLVYYDFNNASGLTIQNNATSTGNYNAQIIPIQGASEAHTTSHFDSSDAFVEDGATSIANNEPAELPAKIYVSDNVLHIQPTNTATQYEVAIFNTTGQLIQRKANVAGIHSTTLPSRGIYIVTIKPLGSKAVATKIVY